MGGGPVDRLLCISSEPEPALLEQLRRKFPSIEFTYYLIERRPKRPLPKDLFKGITILATFNVLPERVTDAPDLRLVHFFSAGVNHVARHPIYTDTDITLTTSNGIHGPQIAEWVIMTALVQSHHYNFLYEAQKQHKWADEEYDSQGQTRDLVGQRLGILGYGSIGRQVGRAAKAMGMDVLAYTASPRTTPESRKDHGFIVPGTGDPDGSIPSAWYSGLDKASLHNFLKQDLDVLVIGVPLTNDTRKLISAEEFSALTSTGKRPLLSNISRGMIVDTPALTAALHDGKLRGACLDVTDPEPLPPDHPLWNAPNVLISPHVSGNSDKYMDRAMLVLEENLRRKLSGEKLLNVVDRKRGY